MKLSSRNYRQVIVFHHVFFGGGNEWNTFIPKNHSPVPSMIVSFDTAPMISVNPHDVALILTCGKGFKTFNVPYSTSFFTNILCFARLGTES